MPRDTKARRTITTRRLCMLAVCAAPLPISAACGNAAPDDGYGEITSSPAPLGTVTGAGLTNQHMNFRAAETVISAVNPSTLRHVVTYNAEDNSPFVEYSNTDRFVMRNASQLGWANWRVDGVVTGEGRVRPPPGWAVLWGDPAVARNRGNSNIVYIASLAVPDVKFPSSGVIQGDILVGPERPDLCGSFLGGACIATSTDDGQTFTVSSSNCLKRTDATCLSGHFYDGGSLAPTFNVSGGVETGTGRMFAAFNDHTRSRHDVYQQQFIGGSFLKITDFGIAVNEHPRLRYGRTLPNRATDAGALYMLYENTSGNLGVARYDGGGGLNGPWTIASWTSNVTTTSFEPQLADGRRIRLGPEYDFDIGFNESGVQEIRIVYSVNDGVGRVHMNGASCLVNFPDFTCSPKGPLWSTTTMFASTHQWNPRIAYGQNPGGGNVWQVSFYNSVAGTNNVEVWRLKLSNGGMGPVLRQEVAQTACPDNRGYWGDYDNVVPTVFGQFLRGFTDSSHATCVRRAFNASPMFAAVSGWVSD